MTQEEYRKTGEKGNFLFQIKLTRSQKDRLKFLAESAGYKTISSYVRSRCFDNMSIDIKLNKILSIIEGESKDEMYTLRKANK